MIIKQAFTAGKWFEYWEAGDFFRILTDSVSTTFDVEYYSSGKKLIEATGVRPGYSEQFKGGGFDRIRIRATVDSTVQFVIRLGNTVGYDIAPTGSVTVTGVTNNATFVHLPVSVSSGGGSIAAAKPGRKYLFVQNRDSVGVIWVKLDGSAGFLSSGIRLEPGDSFEMQGVCPAVIIYAIGDIANNANVLVVEA